MTIRGSIFGSGNERELYHALRSQWSGRFALYPNVPFAQVIAIDSAQVSSRERDFLLKTSVDYTLCKPQSGQPILSVEFDGLGHGFSRNAEYVQRVASVQDPHRKLKLDLKLRVCREVGYPLLIVSYDEKSTIAADTALTFVDGLIGHVLSERAHRNTLDHDFRESGPDVGGLSPMERREAIEDFIDGHRIASASEWNPIARQARELESALHARGGWQRYQPQWFYDPDIRGSGGSPADFVERLRAVNRVGFELTVGAGEHEVTHTVWMRNLIDMDVRCEAICEDIAEVLVFADLLNICESES